MPAIDIDHDAAHQAAQRELDKPIYPKASLSQRVHEWIHDLLFRLLENGSSVPGGWLTLRVLFTLLIVAIVIGIRVARRTIRTHHGGDYQLFDTAQLSADQHRAIAERFAAEGNWTAAIRHRLRAVARGLEETRILDPAPGRTANELARDAGARIEVPEVRLGRSQGAEAAPAGARAESRGERGGLDRIAQAGAGAVRFDIAQRPRVDPGDRQGL